MKRKIFGIGITVLLLLLLGTAVAASVSMENPPTSVASISTSLDDGYDLSFDNFMTENNIQSISEEDIIVWENKEATGAYELAYITVQLDGESPEPLVSGVFFRSYTVKAHNAWGWTMFSLSARGYFCAIGNEIRHIFPLSYAKVEWWCGWAWSVDYMNQHPIIEGRSGKVYAEAGFNYWIGGTVDLWAYVRCYYNGNAAGNGGKL